jgi:hypothetical protein
MRDPRREYIRLLRRCVDEFTPEPGQQRDATFMGELADAGYVTGRSMRDASGVTRGAVSWGVTVEGRLFLRRLEKEIREESAWSRVKRWGSDVNLCCRRCHARSERLVENAISCEGLKDALAPHQNHDVRLV